MGVERNHCAVYGYQFEGRFDWDRMYDGDEYDKNLVNKLMDYGDTDAEKGEFVLFQDPRGRNYVVAGIVHFVTDSPRWNGPPDIGPVVLDEPDPAEVEAMDEIINEEFPSDMVERKHEEPQHIAFTHNH